MDYIEFIKELDKRIEFVRDSWTDDLALLLADDRIEEGSKKYEAKYNKLSKKYAPIIAELMLIREDAYSKAYKKQEEAYIAQFKDAEKEDNSLVDENGRPKGKYWKDGAWHDHKKTSNE